MKSRSSNNDSIDENYHQPGRQGQVWSVVSARGGAGKTSFAIGTAQLLSQAGFKVVLVDFDLATHGACFYLKEELEISGASGIINCLSKQPDDTTSCLTQSCCTSMMTKAGYTFVPSRTNLNDKINIRWITQLFKEQISSGDADKEQNQSTIARCLSALLKQFESYDYIIIDNPASFNLTAEASMELADKIIILHEFNLVSREALRTFRTQYGDAMGDRWWTLANKLADKDFKALMSENKKMARFRQELRPLPFNHTAGEVLGKISPFSDKTQKEGQENEVPWEYYFALMRPLRMLLEDNAEHLRKFDEGHRESAKNHYEYHHRVGKLVQKREYLEYQLSHSSFSALNERRRRMMATQFATAMIFALLTYMVWQVFSGRLFWDVTTATLLIVAASLSGIFLAYVTMVGFFRKEMRWQESAAIRSQLDAINAKLENFKSLMDTEDIDRLLEAPEDENQGIAYHKDSPN